MYCSNCGSPMADSDKFCPSCGQPNGAEAPRANQFNVGVKINAPEINAESAKGFWEQIKNHMGIGDPDLNKGDAFEKDKSIVPECVEAEENEIPIKQYKVATLRNRILIFPYSKAVGRIQVTNKRVIFRAPGRCIAGRTTLQHEFAVDEIAGMEARREYVFNFWDFFAGVLAWLIGGLVVTTLIELLFSSRFWYDKAAAEIILQSFLALAFGAAGALPFCALKRKWLLKLLCLGGSALPMLTVGLIASEYGRYRDTAFYGFFGKFLLLLSIISVLFAIFALFFQSIKPNLVIKIKTKVASGAIDIRRKGRIGFGGDKESHTGYSEVIPADDAERCIREIDALISDVQKRGDLAIGKWKA